MQPQRARSLTLLTSPGGAAAAPFIAELDAVIGYAAPWVKHDTPQEGDGEAGREARPDAAIIEALAARRFDAAVIFTSFSQSALPAALLCCLAGIPLRLAHCRENPYRLLSDWIPDPEPHSLIRHEVRRGLDLVASVGCVADSTRLSFTVREHDLAAVRRRLAGAGGDADSGASGDTKSRAANEAAPLVLLHPGASAPSRRYPAERWADVAHALSRRIDCRLVLTGDAHEAPLLERIRAACQAQGVAVRSLAGQFDLGQLGAAIRLASVLVSNNTGPAHMAAAIGTPVVDLYALTNPQHTPWQVESRVLFHAVPCRFCYKSECPQGHHDCLAKVEPGRVADAVCSLLASIG